MIHRDRLAIKNVGVVGAGTMGSAIAQHFIMKGLNVTLVDQSDDYLQRGIAYVKQSLREAEDRRIISGSQYQEMLSRLATSSRKTVLADCQLIVEAVFEDLAVKKSLFADLESIVSTNCILVSNTSSFLISDIAGDLANPERVLGVHYFYHAAKNKLVEVIPGKETADGVSNQIMRFYEQFDKTPILVKDVAGFAVNRFFVPWLNEAVRLLQEGHGSITNIDHIACQVFAVNMGPFALMNTTGVAIAQHAAQGLADKLGEFYAPARLLEEQVASGTDWDLTDGRLRNDGLENPDLIRSRLMGATLGIAAQMVGEGVVDATSADLGARAGLRWPSGPFELMEKISPEKLQADIAMTLGAWQLAVPHLPSSDTKQSTMRLNWVTYRRIDNTGIIEFNLPDRMNPLGEKTMQQLAECVRLATSDEHTGKFFVVGKGKAFVAGADIKFFLDAMADEDLDRIQKFTEFGQSVFSQISESEKTTCAYLNGLALGGGLELALSCDYRIATRKAVLGFPETGIGIYPGLGGTQRTSRLIGPGLTKFLIATGQFVNAEHAYHYGLVDEVIEPVLDLQDLAACNPERPQAGRQMENLLEQGFRDFSGIVDETILQQPFYRTHQKALSRKAPIALKIAMELIDDSARLSLQDGLDLELSRLAEVFSSQDARLGLLSILDGSKAEFSGE